MAINWTVLTGTKTTLGSIANWLNRSDLPVENILLEAEAWIYERLRTIEMQTRNTAFAFASGSQTANLPAVLLDPISFTPYGHGCPLLYVHEEALQEQRASDGVLTPGTPSRWTIIGEQAVADVSASQTMSGVLLYYARPASLSSANLTNFLTLKYPSLLRYACMMKAFEHMKDTPRTTQYVQLAMAALADAMRADDLKRRGQYIPA